MSTYASSIPEWLAPFVLNDYNPLDKWWTAHWHTQLIEVPIYLLLLFWTFKRWWIALPVAVFVNLVTHPVLWYYFPYWDADASWLMPCLPPQAAHVAPYYAWLVIAETCVFVTEGLIIAGALTLWGKERPRAAGFAITYGLLTAFLANVPSTLAGLLF